MSNDPAPLRLIPRRDLVKRSMVVAGSAAVAALPVPPMVGASEPLASFRGRSLAAQSATPVATPIDLATYVPIALTSSEFATLEAILDRLIPSDELGAGAVEAGVSFYLDQALAGPYASKLAGYQVALPLFDQEAGPGGFAALAAQGQDAILTRAEEGDITALPPAFFTDLLQHAREGYFGDPVHGGNRNYVGWDLVHFPGIKLIWTAEEQAIGTNVEPAHTSVATYGGTGS